MSDADAPVLVEPLENHRLDEARLRDWLSGVVPEAASGLSVRQFQGGMSNPTYLLRAASGARFVLRKKPPGRLLPKAHAVDREYRVMTALGPSAVPVPEMLAYCDDADVIGAEFYVMRHVAGRVISDPLMGPLAQADRAPLACALIDTLADLHSVDWRGAGLEGFGRPEGYLARQVSRWAGQVEAGKEALPGRTDHSTLDALRDWLTANADVADAAAIVHGDYRLGNVIVAPDRPEVAAVLDWELCTIGHPLADLAYLCLGYRLVPEFDPGADPVAAGVPGEDALLARYAGRTGRRIDDWPVFVAFAAFRYAAIIQGVAARAAAGNASSAGVDPMAQMDRVQRIAAVGLRSAAA